MQEERTTSIHLNNPLKPSGGAGLSLDSADTLTQSLDLATERAAQLLLSQQTQEGYWCSRLEGDTSLESDTIKLMHLLGKVDVERQEKLIRSLVKQQLPSGGWPIYRGGPSELNATVKAYVALRLAGRSAQDPALVQAREAVLRMGGLERANSFEKTHLALLDCYPWDQVPALPPELILLPKWFFFNLYEVAYWSRTILVPLSVIYATRPKLNRCDLTLEELWVHPGRKRAEITNFQKGGFFWRAFFLVADRLLKFLERLSYKPLRARALHVADRWLRERMKDADGLGAIYPAMVNMVIALKGLGYRDTDSLLERSIEELARLDIPDGEDLKVQPCFSPVWDTALAMYALEKTGGAGVPEALQRATQWLKSNEVRILGDWKVKNPHAHPGGWAFQYRNPYYPDVDDTAQALLSLWGQLGEPESQILEPYQRGLSWVLSMQNQDGGWSAFDKDNNRACLNHFPFADHNAMLDPSANDITGRVLEMLARAGVARSHSAFQRGIHFLRQQQELDGTWYGRWGVNYIYGTWLALRGLKAAGEPMESVRYQQAGRWLIGRQNPDGGWGESCRSYDDPSTKGQGASTASQTAWALMALMSLGVVAVPAFRRGLDFLLHTQQADGDWSEEPFTGTGFPRVFYLRYHLYRTYFPLLALTEARTLFR